MGYAVILSSDDEALASQLSSRPGEAVRDLVATIGSDSYSQVTAPQSQGAWQWAGRAHSTQSASFLLTPHQLSAGHVPGSSTPAGTWAHGRGRWQVSTTVAVVRPARTRRSVWWAYADSFPWLLSDAQCEDLAAQMQLMLQGWEDYARVGGHTNALSRAGGLVGDGPVEVFWVGNRVCALDGLDAQERSEFFPGC